MKALGTRTLPLAVAVALLVVTWCAAMTGARADVVYDPVPLAVAEASNGMATIRSTTGPPWPQLTVQAGMPVTFSHAASALDSPVRQIVCYQWVFRTEGPYFNYWSAYDWSTLAGYSADNERYQTSGRVAGPTHIYPTPGIYWAGLRVIDDSLPSKTSEAYVMIAVTAVTRPETRLLAVPQGWVSDSASFSWSGSEETMPPDRLTYAYRLDEGDWSPWSATTQTTLCDLSEGSHTFEVQARDPDGHIDDTPAACTFWVDRTPPVITITAPADGALYGIGETVSGAWSVTDAGSGVAGSSATVPIGQALDTAGVGEKTFVVSAEDAAGNRSSAKVTYRVVYVHGVDFAAPIDANGNSCFRLGSTVPVKFRLADATGAPVGNAVATIDLRFLDGTPDGTDVEAVSTSAASTGSLFRFDPAAGQYIFNLGTKGLSKGDYRIVAKLDDGTSIAEKVSLK